VAKPKRPKEGQERTVRKVKSNDQRGTRGHFIKVISKGQGGKKGQVYCTVFDYIEVDKRKSKEVKSNH
jgi:hypothetical protein